MLGGLGINILTTPRGVMTGRDGAQGGRRRRNSLPGLVEDNELMSQSRKKADPAAEGREDQDRRQLAGEGPKGKLTVPIPAGIAFEQTDGKLEVKRDSDEHAALHGLTRALAANAVRAFRPDSRASWTSSASAIAPT